MSNEFGYIGEVEQSFGNNKGIFTPTDIYDLTRADKYTNYGQLELIQTQEITSSTATMDFTNISGDKYSVHLLTFSNFQGTTDGNNFQVRFFEKGVIESASNYHYQHLYIQADGSTASQRSTSLSYIRGSIGNGNANNEIGNGYMYFYNLGDNQRYSFTSQAYVGQNQNSLVQTTFGIGMLPQTSNVDGIRCFTANSIDTLKATLYGIRSY